MLRDHIVELIEKALEHPPTSDQSVALELLSDFILSDDSNSVFILRGYAGTGKTTLISALVKVWQEQRQRVVLLAPTGRAAKVVSSFANFPASTIHKKIYRRSSSVDIEGKFLLNRNPYRNTLFIVDEASMIGDSADDKNLFGSGNLLLDLLDYVDNGKGCKLIFSGDVAQLPPVGLRVSPALLEHELQFYGKKAIVATLREVVRQTYESGILSNATEIRNRLIEKNYSLPLLRMNGFSDVEVISSSELFRERLEETVNQFGIEQVLIITRSNQKANQYNVGIRHWILGLEEEIASGDRLMVVKNNYFWNAGDDNFIANGDTITLKRVRSVVERYGFRFAEATVVLSDSNNTELDTLLLLDTVYSNAPSLSSEQNRSLFFSIAEDYGNISQKPKRLKAIREDRFFNALQVKFAYALTCHKAQGGQWKAVFVDPGFFSDDMLDVEYLRWLYTAFTRAQERLFLVNFSKRFFY